MVNCYNIYYIDSILENAKRKTGKFGRTGSTTRTKGTSNKTCGWIFEYFQSPVPFVWTNVKFRQTSLENHVNFHMTPSPHTPPPLFQKSGDDELSDLDYPDSSKFRACGGLF